MTADEITTMVTTYKENYWEKEMITDIKKEKISSTNENNYSETEKIDCYKKQNFWRRKYKILQLEPSQQSWLI